MIYLDHNGKPTPGNELCWYGLAPCGCANSVWLVALGNEPLCITAEDARLHANGDSMEAAAKDGREFVLGLRTECADRMSCTHEAGAA